MSIVAVVDEIGGVWSASAGDACREKPEEAATNSLKLSICSLCRADRSRAHRHPAHPPVRVYFRYCELSTFNRFKTTVGCPRVICDLCVRVRPQAHFVCIPRRCPVPSAGRSPQVGP